MSTGARTAVQHVKVEGPTSVEDGPSGHEDGVVAAGVYAGGRRIAETTIDAASEWTKRAGHVVWIGLFEPSDGLLRRVQQQFGLHPLAIQDALRAHHHPKLEEYGDAAFVVTRTAQIVDDQIALGETQLFVGSGYVVSVRHGASTPYTEVRERCEARPEALGHGEDYIVYSILDFIVSNYGPVIDKARADVATVEDQLMQGDLPREQIERLYLLRRALLKLRDAVTPLRDVCRKLEASDIVAIDLEMQHRFRDVTNHVDRTRDDIDSLREVLTFAFEASVMMGQTRQTLIQSEQTLITRQLAAWAAILAVPTAIAGIYGMNFEHMPELSTRYGYFVVLFVIATVCCSLYWRFRKSKWL